jgi:hypothetical protein
MRAYICTLLIIPAALLIGCAQPASYASMTVTRQEISTDTSVPSKFRRKLTINSIDGGKDTNPALYSAVSNDDFKLALGNSLKEFNYIAEPKFAQYKLDAKILDLQHPLLGINFTTTSIIKYSIVEIKNNKLVFDDKIESIYSAKFSDALYATTRLRLSIEGSVKSNIKTFCNCSPLNITI